MNEGCRVNNANIGSILKELTKSMENMNATPSEIATMQKDFLSQFGINVGDIFMERASINIENCDMTEDEKSIVEYLRNTNEKYVCSIMIWQEALKRKGKPTKSQTAKISFNWLYLKELTAAITRSTSLSVITCERGSESSCLWIMQVTGNSPSYTSSPLRR